MNTEESIDFVLHEIESSLTLLYSYLAFANALNEEENVKKVNKNYKFWKIHFASVQRALFIYLGRLSDDGPDCKSFTSFRKDCFININDFTKESFLKRKPNILEINPQYFDDAEFPTEQKLGEIFALSGPCNQYLRKECRIIRSQVFAHAILEKEKHYEVFNNIEIDTIEESLLTYYTIVINVWESFYNAKPMNTNIKKYPGESNIIKATLDMINK